MPIDVNTIKAGDTVLSKVGSYPLWPAVVLPLKYVPEIVLNDKPNTKRPHYCVSFFNDPTFYWNTFDTLSPLTKDDVVKKSKMKQHTKAVEDFQNYTDIATFLREKELLAADEQYEDGPVFIPPPPKKAKTTVQKRKPETELSDQKPKKSLSRKDNFVNVTSAAVAAREKKSVHGTAASTSNKVFNQSTTSIADHNEKYKQTALLFRSKLQRGLLQRKTPATEEELSEASSVFKQLETFAPKINTELLRISKLHKVLKAITKVPELERASDFDFHYRSNKLLLKWESYIEELKVEKDLSRIDSSANVSLNQSTTGEIKLPIKASGSRSKEDSAGTLNEQKKELIKSAKSTEKLTKEEPVKVEVKSQ